MRFEFLPQEVRHEPELHESLGSEIITETTKDRALELDERMVGIWRRKLNCEPFVCVRADQRQKIPVTQKVRKDDNCRWRLACGKCIGMSTKEWRWVRAPAGIESGLEGDAVRGGLRPGSGAGRGRWAYA
jgi:hypothetical protein